MQLPAAWHAMTASYVIRVIGLCGIAHYDPMQNWVVLHCRRQQGSMAVHTQLVTPPSSYDVVTCVRTLLLLQVGLSRPQRELDAYPTEPVEPAGAATRCTSSSGFRTRL
jgi:hypothetical protein